MTTEAASASRRSRRLRRVRGLSVRTRITAAISVLVLVALGAAGTLLWLVGQVLIDQRLARDADQELAEFVKLQRVGVDPGSGRPLTSVPRLVRLYLLRNVPSSSELLVGYWDGQVQLSSASARQALVRDPEFVEAIESRLDVGGNTSIDSRWGQVYVDVLPMRGSDTEGAFVVAMFVADEQRELRELWNAYASVAALAWVLVTVVAYVLAGRLLSPLRELREAAQEITETDLTRRIPERGNDDLTELTRTVNEMLERLESAFAGQRQFLDDAGHELRTPLTILRGHLELADPDDPDEIRRTRELLLDETDRMARLVDDLILLTKADRPGFVTLSQVDVADLTTRVRDKAVVMGDRDWQVDGTAQVTALLDEQRLTQALLQLVHNAVRHTSAGDVVAIGSAHDQTHDTIRLWVRDSGPGVPPEHRDRIFERFTRLGNQPGEGEGFGLGLSIVAAIVHSHGGQVRVEDAESGGAVFVIELPRDRRSSRWPAS